MTNLQTIRNSLIGVLSDFVTEAGFEAAELKLIVDLVYEISDFREENSVYFPNVYLFKKNGGDALSAVAPGADRISLKEIVFKDRVAGAVLKDAATLAESGWSIFIRVESNNLQYGIFRSEVLPISVSSSEQMADTTAPSGTVVLIRNCAKNCVELTTGSGAKLELALTPDKPETKSVASAFVFLAEKITADIKVRREEIQPYIERLLFNIIQKCHGTIIVVVPTGEFPENLSDGVVLEQKIDLLAAFEDLRKDKSAEALARLNSQEAVLRGMVNSDGITVLSTDCKILAFRCFVKPTDSERDTLDAIEINGGARSRAHELLKLRIGNPLTCVFFRSQDGQTQCTVNK